MGGGSPERVSTPAGAVFLNYASQDAEAAQKICDAFRAAGIEVWFDKSEAMSGIARSASRSQPPFVHIRHFSQYGGP
jgi:hypothetical protein